MSPTSGGRPPAGLVLLQSEDMRERLAQLRSFVAETAPAQEVAAKPASDPPGTPHRSHRQIPRRLRCTLGLHEMRYGGVQLGQSLERCRHCGIYRVGS
jgi:hypothetical protein